MIQINNGAINMTTVTSSIWSFKKDMPYLFLSKSNLKDSPWPKYVKVF